MTECSIRTEFEKNRIRMTVENFSKLKEDIIMTSTDICIAPECICCISCEKSSPCLYVYFHNKSVAEIVIERTLFLYDCNKIKLHEEIVSTHVLSKQEVDLIGSIEYLKDFDALPNDTLIIDLFVKIRKIVLTKKGSLIYDAVSEIKLRADFNTMLENPINPDVSLVVGDECVSAHWAVLCSRSPYFKKMFESGMQESVENSVTITDISFITLKKLIRFLYTAHCFEKDKDLVIEELFQLYYAADKYEVIDLKNLCACKIMTIVSVDNVWQILNLAHRHSDEDLKRQAMNFIKLHSDAAFQTDGWKEFESNEPLAADVFSFFLRKDNAPSVSFE